MPVWIDKLFNIFSGPANALLDEVPYPFLRPVMLFIAAYVMSTLMVDKSAKFKFWRIIFLTAVFLLAFSALGIK